MATRVLPILNFALASSALALSAASLRPRVDALEQTQQKAYFATATALAHHAATADVRFAGLQARFGALLEHQNEIDALREAEKGSNNQPAEVDGLKPAPSVTAAVASYEASAPAAAPAATIVDPHAVQAAFLAESTQAKVAEDEIAGLHIVVAPVAEAAVVSAPVLVEVSTEIGYPEEILVAGRELELLKAALAADKAKAT